MTFPKITLTNTINLVVSSDKWDEAVRAHGAAIPADLKQLVQYLDKLALASGIPLLVESMKDGQARLIFCTERFELGCGLTELGDAYRLHFIAPLSLRRYSQLARRMIFVVVKNKTPWRIAKNIQALQKVDPPQSGFQEIMSAWQKAGTQQGAANKSMEFSPDHVKFLSDLEELIDHACDIERDSKKMESVAVMEFSPVPAERYAREVFQFKVNSHSFKKGDYIRAERGGPAEKGKGYSGTIINTTPGSLTVSFPHLMDTALLRDVEWIKPFLSLRQYEIQKAALKAMRDGNSSNPYLLDIVVDGSFAKLKSSLPMVPTIGDLNLSQSTAVSHAENIPDMLLVVGPPGTGKTKSIREMVKRSAIRGEKVLVTSKNHKAVDNVLAGLKDVDVLRIGKEEVISEDVRPLMIDVKAVVMQEKILSRTNSAWESFTQAMSLMPQIDQALDQLSQNAAQWQNAIGQEQLEKQKLGKWEKEIFKTFQPVIGRLEKTAQAKELEIVRLTSAIQSLSKRNKLISALAGLPLIGGLFNRSLSRVREENLNLKKRQIQSSQELKRAKLDRMNIFKSYQWKITESDDAIEKKKALAAVLAKQEASKNAIHELLARMDKSLSRFPYAPSINHFYLPHELVVFIVEIRTWQSHTPERFALLGEWRDLLSTRHQALYPVLIRMADVVGATCIGIATDARFEDLEFDLAIADEAGQIQAMDLLVPLVRAKKAILVGDHKQLPPTVNEDIKKRLDPENQEQVNLLEKSLFEQIIERDTLPATRKVILDTQYRIPPLVADFISAEFYENKYKTGHAYTHHDYFFEHPMVFIDTKQANRHYETAIKDSDGKPGYINDLEAKLIVSLVQAYQRKGAEWGVIVPYKKQAELIRQKLGDQSSDGDLDDKVATVDSFQGKERDIIIFGFTRSNRLGNVGFLAEQRRLNVSLTRARHQLILVGDSAFLTETNNKDFSILIARMMGVIRKNNGACIHAEQIREYLSA